MSRPELTVDFESHGDAVTGITVSQLNAVSDIILRMNRLDDKSMSLLCDVLSCNVMRILKSAFVPKE